ncbi:MAG TPA: glycosyltransferase family 87 protein [Pirellulales bacterium]|nr:glycosyltransferase family 87 protein [Pirellulales bacterium]
MLTLKTAKAQAPTPLLARTSTLVLVFALVAIGVSVHKYLLPAKPFDDAGHTSTEFNNYVIFERAGTHLLAGEDLYRSYPAEHWDLFKYSPTFALFSVPLSWLPTLAGLSLWNAANALVLLAGLLALPLAQRPKALAAWLVLKELMTCLQNSQSNGLVAGLVVLTFVALERDRAGWAGLCLALSLYLKIYGAAAGLLLVFYPCRWRSLAWGALWVLVLGALPLAVVTPAELLAQYRSWLALLANDHHASHGLSVMGVVEARLGIGNADGWIVALGTVGLLAPLVRVRHYHDVEFRLGMLSSLLVWLVIFNHKAESPTYVVAVTGLAIWFVAARRSLLDVILLTGTYLLTCWSHTDLFPRSFRRSVVGPYQIKALGSLFVWPRMVYNQLLQPATPTPVLLPFPAAASVQAAADAAPDRSARAA